jgi:hypothetical protein
MNAGRFGLGMKIGNLERNGGMDSRGNLGLRVGLKLGFVDNCLVSQRTSERQRGEASDRDGECAMAVARVTNQGEPRRADTLIRPSRIKMKAYKEAKRKETRETKLDIPLWRIICPFPFLSISMSNIVFIFFIEFIIRHCSSVHSSPEYYRFV